MSHEQLLRVNNSTVTSDCWAIIILQHNCFHCAFLFFGNWQQQICYVGKLYLCSIMHTCTCMHTHRQVHTHSSTGHHQKSEVTEWELVWHQQGILNWDYAGYKSKDSKFKSNKGFWPQVLLPGRVKYLHKVPGGGTALSGTVLLSGQGPFHKFCSGLKRRES